jgi:hypothetical protein
VEEARAGPLRWFAFDPLSLNLMTAALAMVAAALTFRLHWGLVRMIGAMAALGVVVTLAPRFF